MNQLQQQNVPVLRFPEFSGEWEDKRLENVSSIRTGPFGSTLHEKDYVDEGTPIVTVEHLGELGLTKQNLPLVSDADKKRLKSYHLKAGDIVFSRVGSVDRNSIVTSEEDGWLFSGRLLRIRASATQIFPKFLSFSFQQDHTKYRIRSAAVGQTMPSLNTTILKRFSASFPTLPEQQKIASFLSSLDRKIGQLVEKKALLQRYKKGCMQKLFTQQLRLKDDHGNDFPDWEEKLLGDIATFKKGKGIAKADIAHDGKNKCIRYGELYTEYDEVIDKVVSRTNIEIGSSVLSEENDILMPTSDVTPNGLATASALNEPGIILGGDILIIRAPKILNSFFCYFVSSHKNKIMRLVSGVTVYHIYGSDMATLHIKIPSIPEQQKIADFLSAIDQKINLVATELDHAKAFKKGLLQQMFI